MLPEDPTSAPQNSAADSDSPMSILERRLAEIRLKQDPAAPAPAEATPDTPAPAAPAAPEASHSAAPVVSDAAVRASAHYGHEGPGAVAEAAVEAQEPAAESASDEPATDAVELPGQDPSIEPQAHVAATPPVAPAPLDKADSAAVTGAEGSLPATPEPAAEAHVTPMPEAPTVALDSAEAIEQAPEGVAALPTSATASAGVAAEAAAAHAEEEEEYVPETPAPDFAHLELPAQATYLLSLLRRPDARQNRKQIYDLNRQYETALAAERTAARQRFTSEGGAADDFAYHDSEAHTELTKALQEFREGRARDARAEDEQRAKNLVRKQELLTQLRQLVESAETKDSGNQLKTLQNEWKAAGPVPQKDSQEIWSSYHALLDIYYNNRGLFFEMKELDRRRNLEAKEALVQRAEALAQQPSINKALQELRQLHEEWKNVGPVPNEQRDPIWNRFLQASEKVHDRKKEFMSARTAQETANLSRKTALLEQVKVFGEFHTERVNDWRAKTDELQKLKEEWDAAGLVPRDKAEQLNKQFWTAYKGFFQRKNQFFKSLDEEKSSNLKRKLELCEQAEAALQNPDWEQGREIVIRLQKDWKLIGRVPEKQSDKVWNRFRTACDAFFDRKNQEVKQREHQAQQVSQEQAAHLDRVAEAVTALSVDAPGTLEGFRQHVAEWRAFDGANGGPRGSAERAEEKFQSLMGKYLDLVPGLSYAERSDLLFQLQVERLKSSPDAQQQLYRKEQGLRREINELENDIATLQTNLEFFARSKNANQLREEYQGRIDEAKGRIDALKKQLKIVRA
ncbi:DUF349 domain-containing protein [Hymenobacter sp. BT175]|uniref:DUF349 domain-containing protein n=1 Tax=Hymenobacter translucens TaxID=2886507 RepID=UPI001D0F3848|nr:DUF349 domain-containing protein [Hymenobacter translucens]MCC2544835.1 DUF349 domain-containing protein [Hymenobacter translucens]